jgi:hypothetical protein
MVALHIQTPIASAHGRQYSQFRVRLRGNSRARAIEVRRLKAHGRFDPDAGSLKILPLAAWNRLDSCILRPRFRPVYVNWFTDTSGASFSASHGESMGVEGSENRVESVTC